MQSSVPRVLPPEECCCLKFCSYHCPDTTCRLLALMPPAPRVQLMPLVHEMPRGELGIRLTKQAVNIVVMGALLQHLNDQRLLRPGARPPPTPGNHPVGRRSMTRRSMTCVTPARMSTIDVCVASISKPCNLRCRHRVGGVWPGGHLWRRALRVGNAGRPAK